MTSGPTATPLRHSAKLLGVILALMIAPMLSGCGKKGNVTAPVDEPNTYPQPYPKQ